MIDSMCVARSADVLLRGMGACRATDARCATLRMPAPAVPADVTEQLGLATPSFQDIPLTPAVFRKARATVALGKPAKRELLVSATAVENIVGSLASSSASVLFSEAFGVLFDGELLEIVSATAEQVFGRPYLYRLVLRAPLAQIT